MIARMGNTDRRGPEISDGWQGTSDDGSAADIAAAGGALRVAVIGAGVAGLGEDRVLRKLLLLSLILAIITLKVVDLLHFAERNLPRCHKSGGTYRATYRIYEEK